MIELTRRQLRSYRSVLRGSVLAGDPRGPCPVVLCRSGPEGIVLSCQQAGMALCFRIPGSFRDSMVAFPGERLADFIDKEKVRLEQVAPFQCRVSWEEEGAIQTQTFDSVDPDSIPGPPRAARNAVSMEPGFLHALDEAARTAVRRSSGSTYLQHILLRGRDGSVIATDGKQLLIQKGYAFPWEEDLLLPSFPIFGSRELPHQESVLLGKEGERITLEVGPWLLSLRAEAATRYPDVDRVIPSKEQIRTRLRLAPADIQRLKEGLSRPQGRRGQIEPVTLELEAVPAVLAQPEGGVVTLLLPASKCHGEPLRIPLDRRYLLRVVQLGFQEVLVQGTGGPLLCQDAKRTYLWMPLESSQAVPPSEKAPAAPEPVEPDQPHSPEARRRSPPMPPRSHRPSPDPPEDGNGAHPGIDLLSEAEALRALLQEASVRLSKLTAALKEHRRQSRLLETAMASLRRLGQLK